MSNSRPKKLNDLLSIIAAKTGYSESEISDLTQRLYDDWVYKHLTEFENASILIDHLGVFNFRPKFADETIDNLKRLEKITQKSLDYYKDNPEKAIPALMRAKQNTLERSRTAIKKIEDLKQVVLNQKKVKQERYNTKIENYEPIRNLEE